MKNKTLRNCATPLGLYTTFDNYSENYLNLSKIEWAKQVTKKDRRKEQLKGFIIGIIASVVAAIIYQYLQPYIFSPKEKTVIEESVIKDSIND